MADPAATSATNAVDAAVSATDGLAYWETVPATVDGMLGGYPHVSRLDLRSSRAFLASLHRAHPPPPPPPPATSAASTRALDCGAGVGRVTKGLLAPRYHAVDLVEPIEKFAAAARRLRAAGPSANSSPDAERDADANADATDPAVAAAIGDVFVAGLQDFHPPLGRRYDLVWHQWCLGHLTDAQLAGWLRRAGAALAPGGWIVVKENLSTDPAGRDMFDPLDSCVTRTDASFRRVFGDAGLRVVRAELQRGFPRELLPVRTYALRPA